jgi:hypothetical protein
MAEAKVVDVIWTASKSGYLKPRVRIEPIKLGGVTIEYATGFNGKFIEDLNNRIDYCSVSSMGADIADINGDGFLEIFTTDMLAADNDRIKRVIGFDPYHLEDYKYRANYHYQMIQNCLQLNNGKGYFQEIGNLAGVGATDWSWGALIFDFENDGNNDIFVSNGIFKDIMGGDFREFSEQEKIPRNAGTSGFDFTKYTNNFNFIAIDKSHYTGSILNVESNNNLDGYEYVLTPDGYKILLFNKTIKSNFEIDSDQDANSINAFTNNNADFIPFISMSVENIHETIYFYDYTFWGCFVHINEHTGSPSVYRSEAKVCCVASVHCNPRCS